MNVHAHTYYAAATAAAAACKFTIHRLFAEKTENLGGGPKKVCGELWMYL